MGVNIKVTPGSHGLNHLPLSFSLCLSACVFVVEGQMGQCQHVGEKFWEIETPGEQQEHPKYGIHI